MLRKRGQKGFTMVELMVVMAILAVLAAVVFPAVSGKGEASKDSQTLTDATLVQTAVGDYYKDQVGADLFSTTTVTVLTALNPAQVISNKWPEAIIAGSTADGEAANGIYNTEYPFSNTATVSGVTIDGSAVDAAFFQTHNAIDFTALIDGGYLADAPNGVDSDTDGYQNYLWLVKKATSAGGAGTDDSRAVVVYKLTSVTVAESGGLDALGYEQIF